MNLKRIVAVAFAVFALVAVMASSASAAATTETKAWKSGTTESGTTVLTGSETVTAEIAENVTLGKSFLLKTTVGESKTPLELTAHVIECVSCTIFNEGGGAKGKGKIRFKEVTVKTPSTCKVKNGEVLTNELKVDATYMEGEKALQLFEPASGEAFATITLEKGTGACAISGSYIVKGTVYSEASNKTGKYATGQQNNFSPTINSAAGGKLRLGEELAELTGSGIFKDGGKYFGVE
jgi:hypothetical protein